MIDINYTGMCENCKCADLELDCIEYVNAQGGRRKEWTVRCIHDHACDAMEDRMIEKLRKDVTQQ